MRSNPKAKLLPLEKWTPIDASHKTVLSTLFDVLGAETRVYSIGNVERRVRLLNQVTALVREDGEGEGEEVMLLHDGTHVCVIFGLRSRSNMYVRPLSDRDEIRLPAW